MEQKEKKKVLPKTNAWGCFPNDEGQYQNFADGDLLFGKIRCTYVEIYDKDDNLICSINNKVATGILQYIYEQFKGCFFYTEKIKCKSKDKIAVLFNLTNDKFIVPEHQEMRHVIIHANDLNPYSPIIKEYDERITVPEYTSTNFELLSHGIKFRYLGTFQDMLAGKEFAYIRPNACRWVAQEKPIEVAKPTQKNNWLKWLTIGLTAYGTLK
ncbi:MAG: hypothetical protein ACI392_06630 [Paludibacteraceae bacterium]